MKKIFFYLICTVIMSSCAIGEAQEERVNVFYSSLNNSVEKIVQPQNDPQSSASIARHTYLFEKECNGHVYVICTGSGTQSGVFMIHSPNCSCMQKNEYKTY